MQGLRYRSVAGITTSHIFIVACKYQSGPRRFSVTNLFFPSTVLRCRFRQPRFFFLQVNFSLWDGLLNWTITDTTPMVLQPLDAAQCLQNDCILSLQMP